MDKLIIYSPTRKPNIYFVSKYFIGIIGLLLFIACNKSDKEFTIGSQFLESQSSIRRVDTFAVELSTVMIDSFSTSGYELALVGSHYDSMLGRINCKSFFQIGVPESFYVEADDVYDSVKIILTNSGYSYGDTTCPLTLNFYRLTDDIEAYSTGYLYNTSKFNYDTNSPIGRITYMPMPNTYDSIEVTVNDEIGEQLFNMMQDKDDIVLSDARFLYYYLKGMVLLADKDSRSIIRFSATSDNLKLRVYFHRYGLEYIASLNVDFPIISPSLQFNQISHDFSSSQVKLLNNRREAVIASKMDNSSFLYGGAGLMTKIRFPSMPEILLNENSFILRAELIIKPKRGTYNIYSLPSEIMMYSTDVYNNFGSTYYLNDGSVYTATFVNDILYNDATSYTFDITSYLLNELEDSHFDIEHGILISAKPDAFVNSFERLVFESVDPAPILKLYYVNY